MIKYAANAIEIVDRAQARMQKVLDKIEAAIKAGTFDYEAFFPNSRMIQQSVSPVVNGGHYP